MTSRIGVDELELADAVARHGSVGGAAKELLIAQPSASRRLAAMERRWGVTLFDRDTTGARATPAGRELARQAARLLAELDALPEQVLAATDAAALAVGTIQGLSPMVFTALDTELAEVNVTREIDHGPVLLQQVHEGALDVAVVTIAEQVVVPRGLQRLALGESPLVLVVPGTVEVPRLTGRRPLQGREVLYNSPDLAGGSLHRRLAALGARPRPGATLESTVRVARRRHALALVPSFAARWYSTPGETVVDAPFRATVSISAVFRPPEPSALSAVTTTLRRDLLGAG